MRYRVEHATAYRYSQPVFIEPHVIKLRPRSDTGQELITHTLTLRPEPAGVADGIDAENNPFHLAWFDGLAESFEITSSFVVQTLKTNPFDSFLLSGEQFPLQFSDPENRVLVPFLDREDFSRPADTQLVAALGDEAMQAGEGNILGFLTALNQFLFERIEKIIRLDSGIQSLSETLESGRGACRDTALVFIAVCRRAGIPARYVSGCQEGDPRTPEGELHAWAEVYLPGFGWKGFDPTYGLAVADRHIAYAASAVPENTAPVTGTFRGTRAHAQMDHAVRIESLKT